MLLDLGRNDVGRVAEIGTVNVTDSFFLEYYSQVMHIVSNVEGARRRLRCRRCADGGFAGRCPARRVRAMEIIDELEDQPAVPMRGCVGYFSAGGEMDSCIVLRTRWSRTGRCM